MLRLEKDVSEISVAERLSWAANRQTTRSEDVAYCLLGLFGITLPLSYGEGGENAFYRLQEEIIKTTVDMSLFAWGQPREIYANGCTKDPFLPTERQNETLETARGGIKHDSYLLASSPNAFSYSKVS